MICSKCNNEMQQYTSFTSIEWNCVNKQCVEEDLAINYPGFKIEGLDQIIKELEKALYAGLIGYVGHANDQHTRDSMSSDILDAMNYAMGGLDLQIAQGEQLDSLAEMNGIVRHEGAQPETDVDLRNRILVYKEWK